jgi:hypothetical protein
VFGCRDGFHGTSSLNNTNNPVASNLVIVPTDDTGSVCLQSYRPIDVIVDVIGTLTNSSIHTPHPDPRHPNDRSPDTAVTATDPAANTADPAAAFGAGESR